MPRVNARNLQSLKDKDIYCKVDYTLRSMGYALGNTEMRSKIFKEIALEEALNGTYVGKKFNYDDVKSYVMKENPLRAFENNVYDNSEPTTIAEAERRTTELLQHENPTILKRQCLYLRAIFLRLTQNCEDPNKSC